MKEETDWAKKVGFAKIKKLDWTLVDEPIVKELINIYNHADQYVKLKGRQINVGEGVTRMFSLSCEGIVPIGRESYNQIVTTYFIGDGHERYIPYALLKVFSFSCIKCGPKGQSHFIFQEKIMFGVVFELGFNPKSETR